MIPALRARGLPSIFSHSARIILSLLLVFLGACATQSGQLAPQADNDGFSFPRSFEPRSALIFSATGDWRHELGIAGADLFLIRVLDEQEIAAFTSEDPRVFTPERLAQFDLVVFNNVSALALDASQKRAFEDWLEAGGGWIGLHSAGDSSHTNWDWYNRELLGGCRFIGHPADPQFQTARVVRLSADHAVAQPAPTFEMEDEWYSFDCPGARPQGWTALYGLDEISYSPWNRVYGDVEDLRMGPAPVDHPIIWTACVGERGRAVYSALGHRDNVYAHGVYRAILKESINWVRRAEDRPSCAIGN